MKKSKFLLVLAATMLLAGGTMVVSACGGPSGAQSQSVIYDVENEDYEIIGLKNSYKKGETVSFTIELLNPAKKISRVTAGNTKLEPDEDGVYSFIMGDESVTIKVTLSNVAAPTLAASYTGRTEVGQTITISATINGEAINDFTVTAPTGANLVTINGASVTLNGAGKAVLRVSAVRSPVSPEPVDLQINIAKNEEQLGTNITYEDGRITAGGEGAINSNRGTWMFWSGDGGSISSATRQGSEYVVNYTAGGTFYSCQLFYKLPYADTNDNYHLRWEVNSDAAGDITVNGQVINLVAGENLIDFDFVQPGGATISVQFGVAGTEQWSPTSTMGGSVFKFKSPRLSDNDDAHTYHEVKFVSEDVLLKDIQVRDGKTVASPATPAKEGYFFKHWADGSDVYNSSLAINKAYNFIAVFEQKSSENIRNVTLKDYQGNTITTIEVGAGAALEIPANLDLGFGKHITGIYTDQEMTTAYDMSVPVNSDITLYAKVSIMFDATHAQDAGLGWRLPDEWFAYGNDGSVSITFNGWGADSWYLQANFTSSLPVGETGKNYVITFTYSINQGGGRVQIYDGNSYGAMDLATGVEQNGTIEYQGGTLSADKKLTFELGGVTLDAACTFTLHSIELAEKA